MSQQTPKVLDEIAAERTYQDGKWGTQFDDKNSPYNWAGYIGSYGFRSLTGNPAEVIEAAFRRDMVKVAALAVAAIEAIDRRKA